MPDVGDLAKGAATAIVPEIAIPAELAGLAFKRIRGDRPGPSPPPSLPSGGGPHLIHEFSPETWVLKPIKGGGWKITHHAARGVTGKELIAVVVIAGVAYAAYKIAPTAEAGLSALSSTASATSSVASSLSALNPLTWKIP